MSTILIDKTLLKDNIVYTIVQLIRRFHSGHETVLHARKYTIIKYPYSERLAAVISLIRVDFSGSIGMTVEYKKPVFKV